MQIPSKVKSLGIAVGFGVVAVGLAYFFSFSGFDQKITDSYYSEQQCGQTGRYGEEPLNCHYEIVHQTRGEELWGSRNWMEQERYVDIDMDGFPDIYTKRDLDHNDPQHILNEENHYFPGFGSMVPGNSSRQVSLNEASDIFLDFDDTLRYLPKDDPYRIAIGR